MSDYSIGCERSEIKKTAVSVIIPVYNKGKYLEELLKLLSRQTFVDFECLLVDDGSTDGSGSICDRFQNRDSKFRVWHIPNRGVSHARNFGIDHSRGRYITFIDADDLVHEGYLANLYEGITEHPVDMALSGYLKFEGDIDHIISENILPYREGVHRFKELLPEFASIQKESGIYGACVAKIFSKAFLGDIRFDERLNLAEDFDFYLRMFARANKVYIDTSALYYYRAMADNSTSLFLDHKIDYFSQFIVCLRYYSFLNRFKIREDDGLDIVSWQIRSFAYLTLRYANPCSFKKYFRLLKKYQVIPYYNKGEKSIRKKIIMLSLDYNSIIIPWVYFRLYQTGGWLKGRFIDG